MLSSASLSQHDQGDGHSEDAVRLPTSRPLDSTRENERTRQEVERLAREHGTYLRRLARRLCRAQVDPDDLVQDVMERVLRSPVPAGANERAWLSRVTFNLFIDHVRRCRTRREDLTAAPEPALEASEPVWWDHLGEADVRAHIARLPDDQRRTFELFAFDGKSYETIAARLGIAKATVGTRILRARKKLRVMFAEAHGEA